MTDIHSILAERGRHYGPFAYQAIVAQGLKNVMRQSNKWSTLSPDKVEALEMIAHKIARILNGNTEYPDNWIDIAGYAQLIASGLEDK